MVPQPVSSPARTIQLNPETTRNGGCDAWALTYPLNFNMENKDEAK